MRDIKERVRDKNPKIRNPAARLPKELVRQTVLEAKEKPRELQGKTGSQSESLTQYGAEKIESVQYRAASVAGKTVGKRTYQGGKKLAGVTYRKIKERKSRQEEVKAAEEAMEQGAESGKTLIKVKPEQTALAKENSKRQVKAAPRVVKVSGLSQEKIKTQASMQKWQVEKGAQAMQKARAVQMARKSAVASAERGEAVLQTTGKGAKLSMQGITAAIQKATAALGEMGKWFAAGGMAFLVVFILIAGIIAGAAFSSGSESSESLSEEVLAYTSVIQRYASQYGIPEYVSALQAIMMQESGGRGTDPMQCSESPYNTRFPHSPGSITEPDYSIEVGVKTFADCISQAGCSTPQNLDKLKLAWQGYNYGNGYIGWALQRGGYTEANALQFSQQQAASHGWSSYGDPQYVPHLLSVIIANIWYGIPYFVIMITAALQGVPQELYEAADMDGAGSLAKFRVITLPHIKSVLILTCLLRVIWIFNGPEAIIAMTNGGPAGSSQIMTSYMYTLINSLDYGKASAIGVICTVILTLYTIFYLKITSLNKED